MIKLYPKYQFSQAFPMESLGDCLQNGVLDDFILHEYAKIDDYPMGCFSIDITQPHNDCVIVMMVDLNMFKHEGANNVYTFRVEHLSSDGFMDIKTDINSVNRAIAAIQDNTIPLYNVHDDIDVTQYDYIKID